ncbi:MAG: SDR family oxidoreductase [Verrucomicrobia bacterium]|nr:SDR family oxidoreductase [Verrucomicrobiota bacterium]
MRVLIVGCGYVGLPLGRELVRQGHEVFGLRRSAAADAELQSAGLKPIHADITKPETLAALPRAFDWVVNCAASGGGGVGDYRQIYLEGTRHLIEWLGGSALRKYVYTSSTSVYGQDDGSWVTESDATEPPTETGRVLVETEALLRSAVKEKNFPAAILRVAGIYGPERGFWFKQLLSGEARIEGSGERFLNMIHRDDVVGGIIAALESGKPGEVYNSADDEPVRQFDFFAWLAHRLGRAMPPSLPPEPNVLRKRGVTNKRVSNRRLKDELGYQFSYPTFREGYAVEIERLLER